MLRPRNPLKAILVAWAVAFPVSIVLAVIARTLLPQAAPPQFEVDGLVAIAALVVFAPVVETLIMGSVLLLLSALVRPEIAVALSAIGWGIAHSLAAPVWGLIIWGPFLIFSLLFVTWRRRSIWLAFLVPIGAHALQNLVPAVLIATGSA